MIIIFFIEKRWTGIVKFSELFFYILFTQKVHVI